MKFLLFIVFIIFIIHPFAFSQTNIAFPLKQSSSHQYVVDNNNTPVFLNGASPWRLSYKISMNEVKEYLQDRKQKGFNALIIEITPDLPDEIHHGDQPNVYNEHIFFNEDISKPNEAYFKHVDSVLALCNEMNFAVLLFPLYTGCCEDGWKEIMDKDSQSVTKAYNYGKWITSRYKHLANLIWVSGGDYNETPQSLACAKGIAETDTTHLHTFHPSPGYTSLDRLPDAKWLTLDMVYTYYPALISERLRQQQVYVPFFHEWQKKINMPVFMGESSYEYERDETTQFLRRQAYWSLLSGASGHFFGQRDIWPFNNNWKDGLNTPGVHSMEIFGKFAKTIPWYNMQPDWPATLFVSGRGEFNASSNPGGSEYATAAFSDDKKIGVIYLPAYRIVGVNMARFAKPVTAQWFDPSDGTYTTVKGIFENKGVKYFTPLKFNNAQGFDDWVLILKATE